MFRFKFMPTPSGPLHLGHAWIVLLMDRLAADFRAAGQRAELVLMLDALTNHHFQASPETTEQCSQRIIEDLAKFDVKISLLVNNDEPHDALKSIADLAAQHPFQHWDPALELTPEHYLRNAWLDAHYGITHIVRGMDRLVYDLFYRECYALLEYPAPQLAYVPAVETENGARISAGWTDYLLAHLLESQDKDSLWQLLWSQCVESAGSLEPEKDFSVGQLLAPYWSSAQQQVLLNSAASVGRLLVHPKITLNSPATVLA